MVPTFSSRTVEVASNFLRASSSAKKFGAIPYYALGAQIPPPLILSFYRHKRGDSSPYIETLKLKQNLQARFRNGFKIGTRRVGASYRMPRRLIKRFVQGPAELEPSARASIVVDQVRLSTASSVSHRVKFSAPLS